METILMDNGRFAEENNILPQLFPDEKRKEMASLFIFIYSEVHKDTELVQEIKEADPKKSVLTIYYQRNYGTDSGTLYIYGVSKDSSGNIIYDGSSVIRIVEGITNFSTVGGGYSNMFGGYLAAG